MVIQQRAEAMTTEGGVDAYRQAEQRLFDRYGLAPEEQFVTIDEPAARLRVLSVGAGEPILFIPGTGGTGPYWAPLVAELDGFRCLLVDRPGWGLSSPIDYASDDYRQLTSGVLVALLDAMEIKRAHVVGGSIGNTWALSLAHRAPSRAGKAVLIGGFPYPGWKIHRQLKLLRSPLGVLLPKVPQGAWIMRRQLRDIGHGRTLDAGGFPDEFFAWRVALVRHTNSMRHEREMVRAIVSGDQMRPSVTFESDELAAVRQQVLMVYGSSDPIGTVELWHDQLASLPNGRLAVLGTGHLPWWDEPQQVGAVVRDFLTN